jgi:hypothetical protein
MVGWWDGGVVGWWGEFLIFNLVASELRTPNPEPRTPNPELRRALLFPQGTPNPVLA